MKGSPALIQQAGGSEVEIKSKGGSLKGRG